MSTVLFPNTDLRRSLRKDPRDLFPRLSIYGLGFLLVVSASLVNSSYGNLLVNSDLETEVSTNQQTGWFKQGCNATLSSESYTGNSSVQVTGRKAKWAGMAHNVNLEAGKNYFFTGFIKLLNTAPGSLTAKVLTTMKYENSVTGVKTNVHVATSKFMQPSIWQRIGGDLTPLAGYDLMRLFIQIESKDVNYLLDTTSLTEIPSLPSDWDQAANTRIDDNRKADININVASGDTSGVVVEVKQLSSEFAFGSAVSAVMIVDSNTQYKQYQDFFYDNFEWATIENKLKWKATEWKQGKLKYDAAVAALSDLRPKGINVRGHAAFWGAPDKDPSWVQSLQGDSLKQEMWRRLDDVTNRTVGQLAHWDVNNENVHGNFYEEATGEVNITMEMFRQLKARDAGAKLFLNDYAVVKSATSTQAYRNQAQMYKDTPSVPIYGVGIQSHLTPPLDLTLIKHRLDQIVEVGLPIWITELDINEPDADKKADMLENVLRLYFSTPAVEGVLLWGFWDQRHSKPDAALANGSNVTANAAGLRWQQLVKQEWRTDITLTLTTGSAASRGFKGKYSVKATRNGDVLQEQQFELGSSGANVELTL